MVKRSSRSSVPSADRSSTRQSPDSLTVKRLKVRYPLPGLAVIARSDERRSWFVFVIQLPEGTDRDAVIKSLASNGIAS